MVTQTTEQFNQLPMTVGLYQSNKSKLTDQFLVAALALDGEEADALTTTNRLELSILRLFVEDVEFFEEEVIAL